MTNKQKTDAAPALGYASSHEVLRLSAKRYDQSPYLSKYMVDDAVFGLYANRFYPLSLNGDPVAEYWKLRREAMLYDVPEKPLEISGPDALELLERVFTRKISGLKQWRARYAIACTPQGKILMDGVLIKLDDDRYWYVQANGEFQSWLLAHSAGLDVRVHDPKSWVLQIQGPKSLEILDAATEGNLPDDFNYFHAKMFNFGGQDLLVTRTGWTGEMGFEVYSTPETDHLALWDHLIEHGQPFGMISGSLESMGIRRIEAGILDNGTDIDPTMTPFEAGLGMFVNFKKESFVGRDALQAADRTRLLFGLVCESGIPGAGFEVHQNGAKVGQMTTGGWSPTLEKGIGYVRFQQPADHPEGWLSQTVTLVDRDGERHAAQVVLLPFYDEEKRIPKGLAETTKIEKEYIAENRPEENKYVVDLGDNKEAYLTYRVHDGALHILHTEVPAELRGGGYGKILMEAALTKIEEDYSRVVPLCSYARIYMMRNKQWAHLQED